MTPLNSYFLQGSPSEQRLVQDLINEQLKMYGQDVLYLPRKIVGENNVIKEITASKFDDSFRIEAYLMNSEGFGGNGELLTKFGIRNNDEINLVISKERYNDFIIPKLVKFTAQERKIASRPQEGDLIWFPLDQSLFEIKYVEGKKPFYQLQELYVYELRCERFEYEDEIIDIGVTDESGLDVNETVKDFGNIYNLQMVGSAATTASASVQLRTGYQTIKSVQYIDLVNDGYGYSSPPTVTIQKPFYVNGTRAIGTASIGNDGKVSGVSISNTGTQYTSDATVTFSAPTASSEIRFGTSSLYHDSYTDVSTAGTVASTIQTGANLGVSIRFWLYPTSLPEGQPLSIIHTPDLKIYMDAASGAIKWKFKEVGDVTGETVTVNQWNYVQVDFASSSVKISVNGQTLGTLPQPGSDGENIFTSGQTLKIGDADSTDSVADEADRSFLGYIDDLSIDTIYGAFPNITVPNVERSGNYFTNAFNLTTATGTPEINFEGNITSVNITNPGSGYTTAPTVTFSLPTNGVQATAVAIMTSRYSNQGQSIDRILITDPGIGYTTPPKVTITGGGGSGGIATAVINTGVLGAIGISSGGVGYTTAPQVFIDRIFIPSSSGISSNINNASAESVINSDGEIVQIRYSNAGAGYTSQPAVTFTDPTSDTFGDYSYNQLVSGTRSGTTGYVKDWDYLNRVLKLSSVSGSFQLGESIVGTGVSYKVSSISNNEFLDEFASNLEIESEADQIIDFSQRNPFGEF